MNKSRYHQTGKSIYLTLLFLIILSTTFLVAQENKARGTVFLDNNENGRLDKGESGIADVKVSNGLEVVKTNDQGRYEIELLPENILFISKPANYDVPLNGVKLPQFYYRHYPNGTPKVADWKWQTINSTGPLPKTIDFPLLNEAAPTSSFKALGFADPQTATDEELDMMRKDFIDALFGNPHNASFGLVAGDVVNDNLGLYERHNRLMSQIGVPIWNVPGNHDLNLESPNYQYATQTFKSVFGPTYYSFDYGEVHFLALNNVGFKGKDNGYEGHIDERQLKWIENDLQDVPSDKLIMIITHIPLLTYADRSFPRALNTVNFEDLLQILKRFEYIYTISGHDTSNSWKVEINHTHGWHGRPFIAHTLAQVQGGSWYSGPRDERGVRTATMQDGNPNGYYLFHFDGIKVKPEFIPAGEESRLRVMLDPPLINSEEKLPYSHFTLDRGTQPDSLRLVVNYFDGGERDRISVSLNGQNYVPMEYIEAPDPFYQRQYARYADEDIRMRPPINSSHIWQLALPKLKQGIHTAKVTVLDEFGMEDDKNFTFEILEKK